VSETSGVPAGLDELSLARLEEGRTQLTALIDEHAALGEAVVAERNSGYYNAPGMPEGPALSAAQAWDVADRLEGRSPEQLRCLLLATAEYLARGGHEYGMPADCWYDLTHLPLGLVTGDVRLLAATAEPGGRSGGYQPFKFVVEQVGRLLDEGALGAASLAEAVAGQAAAWNAMAYHRYSASYILENLGNREIEQDQVRGPAAIRDKAFELAGYPPAPPPLEGAVSRNDAFGLAVIGWLGLKEDWPPGVAALLGHCSTAKAPRPASRWEKACRQRLAEVTEPSALLRHLLGLVLSTEPVSYLTSEGRMAVLVGFNEQLIKGLIWAAGILDPPWLPEILRAVAAHCLRLCSGHVFRDTAVPGEKIPYACMRALASSGSDASLLALARIGRATSNGAVLKNLTRTLEEVSARHGMSAASLLERLTPDHGLDEHGQVTLQTEAGTWTLNLDDRHGATVNGPSDLPVPQEVAETLAELKATMSVVRQRLEGLFAQRREWHADDFGDCYIRHPLTGWLARRLVWSFTPESGPPLTGFPGPDGQTVRTTQGTRAVPPDCVVSFVHPVLLSPGDRGELRRLAGELSITQPLRQLWREIYELTAEERATGLWSGRYAGHVLRFNQCYGLARRRGWSGGFLSGAWDGGDSAIARRDYSSAGLRASWAIAQLDQLSTEVAVDLCMTENVSFSPLGDSVRAPVPLADVPPEIFSEAMRDLDLVVSVTTVANDPIWLEEYCGHPGLDTYWERISAGGLDQLRVNRREVLTPFFEGEAVSRPYRLTDRELIVTGSLATYRIDLATANVQLQPTGKWLSFDTRLGPFDGLDLGVPGLPALDDDEILQRVLVRAAILADDERLASRKLLRQIRG
jgi:Domain of unknown function (DUF4132)